MNSYIIHICQNDHMFATRRLAQMCVNCGATSSSFRRDYGHHPQYRDYAIQYNGVENSAMAKLVNFMTTDLYVPFLGETTFNNRENTLVAADWWEEHDENGKAAALRTMFVPLGSMEDVFFMNHHERNQIISEFIEESL